MFFVFCTKIYKIAKIRTPKKEKLDVIQRAMARHDRRRRCKARQPRQPRWGLFITHTHTLGANFVYF